MHSGFLRIWIVVGSIYSVCIYFAIVNKEIELGNEYISNTSERLTEQYLANKKRGRG
jgi:hypothetical protein